MRKDIVLIPHLYDIKWSQDFNKFLSYQFTLLEEPTYDSYLPSRTLQHKYMAKVLPLIRKNKITKVFFANILEDFTPDIYKAGLVKETYGFLHGTNFSNFEPGATDLLRKYELGVSGCVNKIFVATEFMAKQIPYKTEVIGLPLSVEFPKPVSTNRNKIIFNHRLMAEKQPLKLLELPQDIKDRMIITCPKAALNYAHTIKKNFKDFYLKTPVEEYHKLLDQCGFGISLAKYDNFGYAVIEGVMNGLMYFVPKNDTTAYQELHIPEMLYETMDELVDKIRYYTANVTERVFTVQKAQINLQRFQYGNWSKNLESKL
jgi:hypothetical protein